MAIRFSNHVVGGIDRPRFLLVGPELSPNVSFEENLTGVSGSAGAYAREADGSTPFGDYVLTVEDNDGAGQEYADLTMATGDEIAGRKFIVLAYGANDAAEGDLNVSARFQGLSDPHEKQFVLDQIWWQHIVHEVIVPGDATGEDLVYRMFPFATAAGNAGQGKMRIDQFRCREILEEFELPLPPPGEERQMWRMEKQAELSLVSGKKRYYVLGMRYFYEAFYEPLNAVNEVLRRKLINTTYDILFFPHRDSPTCYFVQWDDDFESNWAFGKAPFGHGANVHLQSLELLPELPTEVIDALNEYEPPEDVAYFEQMGDSFVYTS